MIKQSAWNELQSEFLLRGYGYDCPFVGCLVILLRLSGFVKFGFLIDDRRI